MRSVFFPIALMLRKIHLGDWYSNRADLQKHIAKPEFAQVGPWSRTHVPDVEATGSFDGPKPNIPAVSAPRRPGCRGRRGHRRAFLDSGRYIGSAERQSRSHQCVGVARRLRVQRQGRASNTAEPRLPVRGVCRGFPAVSIRNQAHDGH
jgi:hypothetical protein